MKPHKRTNLMGILWAACLSSVLTVGALANDNLPMASESLLEQLSGWEQKERLALEEKIRDKRQEVASLLREQQTTYAKAGNVEAALAIEDEIKKLTSGVEKNDKSLKEDFAGSVWEGTDGPHKGQSVQAKKDGSMVVTNTNGSVWDQFSWEAKDGNIVVMHSKFGEHHSHLISLEEWEASLNPQREKTIFKRIRDE